MTFEIRKQQNGQDTEYAAYANGVLISTYDTPQEAQEAIVEAEKALPLDMPWMMVNYFARAAILEADHSMNHWVLPFSSNGHAPTNSAIKRELAQRGILGWREPVKITLASHVLVLSNGKCLYQIEYMPCNEFNQTVYGNKKTLSLGNDDPHLMTPLD